MKSLGPILFAICLVAATGCRLLHHKGKQTAAPELPPATAVQVEYRDRWVDRRIHELMGSGAVKSEEEARAVAIQEFSKQHPYIDPIPAAKR
jgi:hypothetical protein